MPVEAIPFVIAIVAFFSTFIVVLGGVQIWMVLPTGTSSSQSR